MSDARLGSPRVNSIVELLDVDNPAALDALRRRYPAHDDLLRKGLIMGVVEEKAGQDALYCDLCRAGLGAAEGQLGILLQLLPRRLARAKKLRLLAALVAGFSSAGVLTAVFADARVAARVAAGIAFVATMGSLIAQYMETPISGGRASIADSLRELIALESRLRDSKVRLADAEQAHVEAARGKRSSPSCRDLVIVVNDLAAHVRQIQIFAGNV